MAGEGGALDLAALALRIESIGLAQANRALAELEGRGRKGGAAFDDLGDKSEKASQGSRKLEGVLRGVGLSIGGVVGPAGKLGNTLLGFAPGGVYVGAAVLGLGLLSKAWDDAAKQAEESSARIAKAVEASLPGAPKELSALAQRGVIGEEIDNLMARGAGLSRMIGTHGDWTKTREGKSILAEIARLRGRQGALDEVGATAREDTLAGAIGDLRGFRAGRLPTVGAVDNSAILRALTADMKELTAEGVKLAGAFEDSGAATHDYLGEVMKGIELAHDAEKAEIELGMAEQEHARLARQAAAQMLVAGAQLLAGIIQSLKGGDFFGALGGLGNALLLLSAIPTLGISPWIGAAISAGSIIGGSIASPSGRAAPAGGAPVPAGPVFQSFTVIGEHDPAGQAAIARMARAGVLRGYGRS